MIQAVIFDLDNTLIDFLTMKKLSIEAAASAMIDAGLQKSKASIIKELFHLYDKYGWEDQTIFQKYLKSAKGIDYRILAYGINAYRRVRAGFLESYPHVMSTLIELKKKNIALAILSDAPKLQAWIRLSAMKIDHFFDVIVTFEDTQVHKPAKKPFELVLKKLNLDASECLMVGDMLDRDMVGAKKIGMKTCFAKYGARFGYTVQKKKITVDYQIKDVAEILNIV